MTSRTAWEPRDEWSEAEWEWWRMGPFDGDVPGVVRRVRRILDVSQRGLAALLDVSQSVVARWETGRTSPRTRVLQQMFRLARIRVTMHDASTGEEVLPMRSDGARQHGGSRYPAHVDLRVTGWWVPKALRAMTTTTYFEARERSRRQRDPLIRFRLCPHDRRLWRELLGTPDDHPALHQLAAEAEHLDDVRAARRQQQAAKGSGRTRRRPPDHGADAVTPG